MPSFGETLRRERELRRISLREISESTKISLRYLDALERDDFRHLPGGVFNKGFVRAYSQYIGVDAEGMVNAYLDEERGQRERLAARTEPVPRRAPSRPAEPEPPVRDEARRRLHIAAALLIACAALAVAAVAALVKFGYVGRLLDGGFGNASEVARVEIARETSGSFRCGEGDPVAFDGVAPGTVFDVPCPGAIVVDVRDAGAVLVGFGEQTRRPLGADGETLRGRVVAKPTEGNR